MPEDLSTELSTLLRAALQSGNMAALERFLEDHSALPGPRMNTRIIGEFADCAARSGVAVLPLLTSWAELSFGDAPTNTPREILVSAATLAFGQIAIDHPDHTTVMIARLHQAACDPRWRVREVVAMAMQRLLKQNWSGTAAILRAWASDSDPLVIRGAVAAIAEPPLLTNESRGREAVEIQGMGVNYFMGIANRKTESMIALRKALGFTISVAAAAAPDPGFALLERLAQLPDSDAAWIVRENVKKNRLHNWPDRIATLQAIVK